MRSFAKGDRGDEVVDIQVKLATLGYRLGSDGADGCFGDATVKAVGEFQSNRELTITGVVDGETWRALVEATYKLGDRLLYLRSPFFRGDDVRELQISLNTLGFNTGKVDGIYGETTERAVREFQRNLGLSSDGIFGPSSFAAMRNLRHLLVNKAGSIFPDPYRDQPSAISIFQHKKIAVDLHIPDDKDQIIQEGFDISQDLGLRLGNLLELLGADVFYLGETNLESLKDIDIYVGFSLNYSTNGKIRGSTIHYLDAVGDVEVKSQSLATAIQEEVTRALGSLDLGIKPLEFDLKIDVLVPATVIKPLFVTNLKERELLDEEVFRQKIAVAVFDGIKRYLKTLQG